MRLFSFVFLCLFALFWSVTAWAQGKTISVVVAEVRKDRIVTKVEALGTTRANESIRVTSNVSEKVAAIHFEDGQMLEKGDLLITLDSDEERAELAAKQAVMEESRAAFKRIKKLESQKFAATAQLDERRAAMDQAEAEIAMINAKLADRVIHAPFSGRVGLRDVSVGELVQAGDVITTLTDTSVIKLDFTVPSEFLTTLRPGLSINAKAPAFGDRPFEGVVKSIGNQVDPVTRTIIVRAEFPNPDGTVLPGILMTVDLLKDPREALVIPEEAVIQRGNKAHVLVVDRANANTVARKAVKLGIRLPGEVEVLEGVEAGEAVITHGTMIARPGQKVDIRAVQKPGQNMAEVLSGTVSPGN